MNMSKLCLIKFGLLRKANSVITTGVRHAGAWNKDWKPGPYPKTEEERVAAAKKYGLHPKDYQPYPDDGTGFGDYPMFNPVSVEARDPYEHYDIPEFRRNFGEVLHVDFDMYTAERVDCNKQYPIPLHKQFLVYISVMSCLFLIFYLNNKYKDDLPRMSQQYPSDGKKNYSFEPAN